MRHLSPSFFRECREARSVNPQPWLKQICTILLLAGAARGADVTVYQTADGVVDNAIRRAAIYQASRMFAAIGVRLEWKGERPQGPANPAVVVVRYTMSTPGHPGALGFTRPFDAEKVVTVIYDRILAATTANPRNRAVLLAHVLAHEIGHALIENDAHSPEGIMKGQWTAEDYFRMGFRPMNLCRRMA